MTRPEPPAGLLSASRVDAETRALLRRAAAAARRLGVRAYLVGGAVRDLLLGRGLKDLDLAIEGDARALARELAATLGATCAEHAAFETAVVQLADGRRLDLARTRRERYPRSGALPRIEPADLAEDLQRRDFTINSMAVSLAPSRRQRLHDPTGGLADLQRGEIRVLHDRSFLDDPTRAFRAVRFAARIGLRLERRTAALLRAACRAGAVDRLSAARLRRELIALFDERDWGAMVRELRRFGLWAAIHPVLEQGSGLDPARARRLERGLAWYHGLREVEPIAGWALALGFAIRGATTEGRRALVARLRPDRRAAGWLADGGSEAETLLAQLANAADPPPSRIYVACQQRSPASLVIASVLARSPKIRRGLRWYLERGRHVRLHIDGRDLIRAGLAPGPAIATALAGALAAALDGRAPSREQQLAAALRTVRRT